MILLLLVLYMAGAMNDVSYDVNHTNGNKTTTSSSSLLDNAAADAVAVTSPLVRRVYSI